MRALGKSPSQEEVQALRNEVSNCLSLASFSRRLTLSACGQIDPSGEGTIDFNTFCRCMQRNFAPASTESEVLEV